MNIAVFHNLPAGGGKRSTYEWIKLMTKNHEVDLYFYDSQTEKFLDIRPFVRKTIPVSDIKRSGKGHIGRLIFLYQVWKKSKQIAEQINSCNYDLAFIMQDTAFNSPFVLRYLNKPSLYFCQEPTAKAKEPHYSLNRGWLEKLVRDVIIGLLTKIDRSNALHATLICANSLYSRENIYRTYGLYPRLNYLGVDTNLFHPLFIEREPVILSVGSLAPSKGSDFIIKSVATLKKKPAIRFIYHGSDALYEAELTKLANQLDVSVSFDYLPTQNDLVIAYNKATITVFASLLEPLGLVPLESMACGTPVVGIAEAGIRETVQHNVNGLLTERDPHEFGEAINKLMTDNSLWTKMSVQGHKDVLDHWTWENSYQQLEKHIQMTLDLK